MQARARLPASEAAPTTGRVSSSPELLFDEDCHRTRKATRRNGATGRRVCTGRLLIAHDGKNSNPSSVRTQLDRCFLTWQDAHSVGPSRSGTLTWSSHLAHSQYLKRFPESRVVPMPALENHQSERRPSSTDAMSSASTVFLVGTVPSNPRRHPDWLELSPMSFHRDLLRKVFRQRPWKLEHLLRPASRTPLIWRFGCNSRLAFLRCMPLSGALKLDTEPLDVLPL
jgi:hypothetical protein